MSLSTPCVKCSQEEAVILIGTNGSFCRECFEKYFAHKFRASLGKNPVVRHGDKVAVAFSGGNNSSALLHVMLESLAPAAFKKLKFQPGIIFIDETTVLPADDYGDQLEEVKNILKKSGLDYKIVKFEEVLMIGMLSNENGNSSNDASSQLKSLFEVVKSGTSKEELLYRLRCKLLTYKAKELGYHHVFLGETSTRLSVNILSNIAQGRGAHMPLDTGFTDHGRYYGINLLRPLRDISAKEVAVYNALHNVPTVFFPTFSTKMPSNSSIQTLTEDFIVSLSTNFPATETTVFRISNKLQMSKPSKKNKDESDNTLKKCHICFGPLDNQAQTGGASALQALELTEKLSLGKLGTPDDPKPLDVLNSDIETDVNSILETEDSDLCHCCRILRKDLPEDISENLFAQTVLPAGIVGEEDMRQQLDGLLIDS